MKMNFVFCFRYLLIGHDNNKKALTKTTTELLVIVVGVVDVGVWN